MFTVRLLRRIVAVAREATSGDSRARRHRHHGAHTDEVATRTAIHLPDGFIAMQTDEIDPPSSTNLHNTAREVNKVASSVATKIEQVKGIRHGIDVNDDVGSVPPKASWTRMGPLLECGACFEWFHALILRSEPNESSCPQQEIEEEAGDRIMSSITPDLQTHERLRLLNGVGFVFTTCQNRLCSGCFYIYIMTRFKEAKNGLSLTPLSCAHCRSQSQKPDCITDDQIQHILTPDEFDDFQRQRVLNTFKKTVYCPNTACLSAFDAADLYVQDNKYGTNDAAQVTCPNCSTSACLNCGCAWHSGLTCTEFLGGPNFLRDKELDSMMEMAKKEHWRQCPSPTCRQGITLSEGCNHVTCPCGKEFCWLCLSDWAYERDRRGNIQRQYCSRKNRNGPACPLYSEETLQGVQQAAVRQRRHAMNWIKKDRTFLPYQKANTFTRHLLASRRCGYCNVECKNVDNLVSHLEWTSHDVFDCCAKFFKTRSDFDSHVRNTHPHRLWIPADRYLDRKKLL